MVGLVAIVKKGGVDTPGVAAEDKDRFAADGEPVIPTFPGMPVSRFLGIKSQGYAYEAMPAALADDTDQLLEVLAKTYPGLPRDYLTAILVDTLVVAALLDPKGIYRVFVTPEAATLQNVKTGDLHPIWKDMDTRKYL